MKHSMRDLYLFTAFALMSDIRTYNGNHSKKRSENPIDIDVTPKTVIPKGCQVYNYPCYSCIASSQKAADKKYQKYLGLNIPQSIH